jgi:glycosyltransferase involved in cell wall biosynthesis
MQGGAEHSIQSLAETLVKKGLRVSVISLLQGNKPERFTHNGVQCHALPAPHLGQCLNNRVRAPAVARALWHVLDIHNPAAGRLLERELREIKPDLAQTHNLPGWSCAAWSAIQRLGVPHIQVLHDFQLTCPKTSRFRAGNNCQDTCMSCRPFETLRRRFSRRVSHVVANSDYTRQVHRELGFFPAAKTFDVIYGSVPLPVAPLMQAKAGDKLRIGYIGRLHPTKGLDRLIDSFCAAGRTDAMLQIAGTGTDAYESELRQRASGYPVELIGQQPASNFLSSIDVLVVPSLWNEPMGRVVIEAAIHGVPVVASARGGIPELVKEGRTGWLFDPSSSGQLTEILRNLNVARLQAARSDCVAWGTEFTPNAICDRWLALFRKLLNSTELFLPQRCV